MENIINNPGLQHLAEKIFWNLNYEDLESCRLMNESCRKILDNPFFWIKIFIRRGISKKYQMEWTYAIEITKDTTLEKYVLLYLKKSTRNRRMVDLPCWIHSDYFIFSKIKKVIQYLNSEVPNAADKNGKSPLYIAAEIGDIETIKFLAPLTKNPNASDKIGITPIHNAAHNGHTEIVKFLAPLTENPNVSDRCSGDTPIHCAVLNGHTEIVKFLASMTDNPNFINDEGETPMHDAALKGYTDIVKFLVTLTDNPNSQDHDGYTPIHWAAQFGFTEIVKILAPLTENPNSPDNDGNTRIDLASRNGFPEIVQILESANAKRAKLVQNI